MCSQGVIPASLTANSDGTGHGDSPSFLLRNSHCPDPCCYQLLHPSVQICKTLVCLDVIIWFPGLPWWHSPPPPLWSPISQTSYIATPLDTTTINTSVISMTATDADVPGTPAASVTYLLVGPNSGYFRIDNSGNVYTNRVLVCFVMWCHVMSWVVPHLLLVPRISDSSQASYWRVWPSIATPLQCYSPLSISWLLW